MNDELPRAAERIKTKAEQRGWKVVLRRGPTSVALRIYRSPLERVVAVWVDGKFDSAWQGWKPAQPAGGVTPRRLSSRELIALVTEATS